MGSVLLVAAREGSQARVRVWPAVRVMGSGVLFFVEGGWKVLGKEQWISCWTGLCILPSHAAYSAAANFVLSKVRVLFQTRVLQDFVGRQDSDKISKQRDRHALRTCSAPQSPAPACP